LKINQDIGTARSRALLVLAFFVGFSLIMTYPLILHLSDHIPGSLGDSYYSIWVMSWNRHALSGSGESLLDTNIYHPHKNTLYYADPMFLESALNAFLMLGFKNPILTYNLLFLLTFVLCGMSMYWLSFELAGSRLAAVFAGLVFSYFPNRLAHLPHLEILFFGWMPLVFLFLHRFFKKPSFRNLLGFCLFYFLQAVSCSYHAVFIALFIVFFVIYFAYQKGWLIRREFWIQMSAAGLLLSVFLLPIFYPYITVRQKMPFSRPLEDAELYAAEAKDFLSVPSFNRTYGKWMGEATELEKTIFPGLVPLVLTSLWWLNRKRRRSETPPKKRPFLLWDIFNISIILLISWLARNEGFDLAFRGQKILSVHSVNNPLIILGISLGLRVFLGRKTLGLRVHKIFNGPIGQRLGPKPGSDETLSQNFYLFSAVMGALLAMGPILTVFGQRIIEGPYYFFYYLFPGFNGLRVPPRISIIIMMGLAVLSAQALADFMREKAPGARRFWIAFFMGALLIVEYLSIPLPLARAKKKEEIPPIYASIRKLTAGTVLLKFPLPEENQYIFDSETMYYSIYHWRRLVNGYSAYFPPGYLMIREAMEFFPSEETFVLLDDLGVDYVLVQTGGHRADLSKSAVQRIKKYPHWAELVNRQGNDYLYRLIRNERGDEIEPALELADNSRRWNADTNKNSETAHLAFDGDLKTGWSSGWYQVEGDFFILDLGRVQNVRNLELFLGKAPLDFPRGYRLEGSADGRTWMPLDENPFCYPRLTPLNIQDSSKYRVRMSFEAAELRFLKISLTKTFKRNNWSIYEIVCR
jgi:hypothetical protein